MEKNDSKSLVNIQCSKSCKRDANMAYLLKTQTTSPFYRDFFKGGKQNRLDAP